MLLPNNQPDTQEQSFGGSYLTIDLDIGRLWEKDVTEALLHVAKMRPEGVVGMRINVINSFSLEKSFSVMIPFYSLWRPEQNSEIDIDVLNFEIISKNILLGISVSKNMH